MIRLELEVNEVDFIANLLAQVPTGQTLQAGMTNLLPKIGQQAQESLQRERLEQEAGRAGIDAAVS